MTFVSLLGAKQSLLGRRIPNTVFDAEFAYPLTFLRHIDDEAIADPACSASLIIDRLKGGGHNLEVGISLEGFMHLRLVPQLSEKTRNDAKEGRDLGKELVGRTIANCYGEKAVRTHFWTSRHGLLPGGIVDCPAHVQRRKKPGRLLQYADPVLPHAELLRHLEATEDRFFFDHQNGGEGMHPCKHLIGLAQLDELVSFRHGVGHFVERRPRNWVNHLVNGHRGPGT